LIFYSTSRELEDYFGFVYAIVTMTEKVKTPLLYHKDDTGASVLNDEKIIKG